MGEWSVSRTGILLFCLEKLFEVHLEFKVVATGSIDEGGTVLCARLQGSMEQRLQALPELRSHMRFTAMLHDAVTHQPLSLAF